VPGYYNTVGLTATVWGRVHGVRTILMSESTADDHPRSWWRERLKILLVRALFDAAIVGGRRAAQYLVSLGFPADKIAFGYDVVDNDFFSRGTEALRRDSAPDAEGLPRRYFLYAGRLAPEKNLSALIQQFSTYRARGGEWDLVLVGQGPLGTNLRDEAQRDGCAAHIHFAGFKQGAELLPPYAFASCFVLPSTREPWGLVVNEAMASGLPVIVSTRCGCSDDLVEHGGNGFIFDPAREDELVDCMMRMSAMSDEERARMGQRSREIIANFSLERWASEVVRLVEYVQVDREAGASART
jgi:glycosyltransferase involved in cell wall biosynthesis